MGSSLINAASSLPRSPALVAQSTSNYHVVIAPSLHLKDTTHINYPLQEQVLKENNV